MLKLEQHGNHIKLVGSVEYRDTVIDTVTVNGKQYYNEEKIQCSADIEDIRAGRVSGLRVYQYKYDLAGIYSFEVDYIAGLYNTVTEQLIRVNYSENPYIKILWHCLKEFKLTSIPIKGIYNGKANGLDDIKRNYTRNTIEIMCEGYGFNNCLFISVADYHFMKLPESIRAELKTWICPDHLNSFMMPKNHNYLNSLYGMDIFGNIQPKDVLKVFNTFINNKQYATRKH